MNSKRQVRRKLGHVVQIRFCRSFDVNVMLIMSSNVCEAAPISLFLAPSGLNELPEVRFVSPFILIGILLVS